MYIEERESEPEVPEYLPSVSSLSSTDSDTDHGQGSKQSGDHNHSRSSGCETRVIPSQCHSHSESQNQDASQRRGRGRGRGRGRSRGRGRGRSCGRGRSQSSSSRGRRQNAGQLIHADKWNWSSTQATSSCSSPLTYTGGTPGPINSAVGKVDPLECFHLFLTPEFYDDLLLQTNLYANQEREAHNDTTPLTPISREELMAFIGINIAMGIISLPTLNDYWSTDPILAHAWFRTIMSRNRFRQILRFIHVADNSSAPLRSDPDYDRLWKVRPLLDTLSSQCKAHYNPHCELSIDESMIGTKCRLSFIQYMPQKPTKWGIKVWVCCDARTGYIHSFDVYTGADPGKPTHPKGLAYDVVLGLMGSRLGIGHVIYMDNFYTSPELFQALYLEGTAASGTVRTNRKHFPASLKTKKGERLTRGHCEFLYHNEITATRWYDNKDVYALSTVYAGDMTTVRRKVGGETRDVDCPVIICDYNKFMGGVDLADQAMCYYSVGRKTMKWWRRVFWRMHDQAITNAFVIYKANYTDSRVTPRQKGFRQELAYALTSPMLSRRRFGRPPSQELSRLTGKHFPYRTDVRRRCVVCAYKKSAPNSTNYRGTKVMTWCPKCSAHLCIGKCFEVYHTRVKYKQY